VENIFKDLKNEARLAQRKKTSEIFGLIESLLVLYNKQINLSKPDFFMIENINIFQKENYIFSKNTMSK